MVDDVVRSQGADHVGLRRRADGGGFRAEDGGELDGEGADSARGAGDHDAHARCDAAVVAEPLECGQTGEAEGGGLRKGESGGFRGEPFGLGACVPAGKYG
ncbi:hypothetical protein GCM10018773_35080 [Streptomyces candidus]|nr:hypothetical protein GCM10018773_35080 [Streptomyces candidus]